MMDFNEKHKLIEQTVQKYANWYGMFTVDDLVSEAWCHRQVREADEPKHVIKATKDACVDFLRRWYKTGTGRNNREIKITHVSTMMDDNMNDIRGYTEDNTTELLKEDLYKQMSDEERKIVEYRIQGWTYEEIAKKLQKKKCTVYGIHKRMQERMKQKQGQLLGD